MPYLLGLLYSLIPFPASITHKELAKLYKRLLLIARGAKLVHRLVYRVLPFLTLTLTTLITLTTLTTLPALLWARGELSLTRKNPLAVLRALPSPTPVRRAS
jgi:hypothetical protein